MEPVTTDQLALAASEVTRFNSRTHKAHRRELVERAMTEGMHPWTVAFYSGLSEPYVRSLVKDGQRGGVEPAVIDGVLRVLLEDEEDNR